MSGPERASSNTSEASNEPEGSRTPAAATRGQPIERGGRCSPAAEEAPVSQSPHQRASDEQKPEENKTTIWIGDLEQWEDEEHLYRFFERLFPDGVVSVKIARDKETQMPLGFGFIDFASTEIAENAINTATSIRRPHGRKFKATWAKGRTRQPFNPSSKTALNYPAGRTTQPAWCKPIPLPTLDEWIIEIHNCPPTFESTRIYESLIKPLGAHIEAQSRVSMDETTLVARVTFSSSNAFFHFIQSYPDGHVTLHTSVPYTVPPYVMEKWTALYEGTMLGRQPTNRQIAPPERPRGAATRPNLFGPYTKH